MHCWDLVCRPVAHWQLDEQPRSASTLTGIVLPGME